MSNWESRLLQIAQEHPDAPGEAGRLLRHALASRAAFALIQDLNLAHACAREAVVTGTRMVLRCGGLILRSRPETRAALLRSAGVDLQAAEHYMRLAGLAPELRARCDRRRGRIAETEAINLLRSGGTLEGDQVGILPDPVTNLRALVQLMNR